MKMKNILALLAALVVVAAIALSIQNEENLSDETDASTEIAQDTSGQSGGNTSGHWTDSYSVGQWYKYDEKYNFYLIKKDKKNRIMLFQNYAESSGRLVELYILTDKGNYYIGIDTWSFSCYAAGTMTNMMLSAALSNKNISYSDFVEVMKLKAQEIVMTTRFEYGFQSYEHRSVFVRNFTPVTVSFNGREMNGVIYEPKR